MDLKSVACRMDDDPWKISVIFSALTNLVLAFLFLLSVCISITSSTVIKIFHLRPPCVCFKLYGGGSWNGSLKQNPEQMLCNRHANKLSLLKNLLPSGGFSSVHSLCEGCMFLNCIPTPINSSFVNRHTDDRLSSTASLLHVNNCYICSLKMRSSVLSPSTSRPMLHGYARCCSCKNPIEEIEAHDAKFLKEKSAKFYNSEEHAAFEKIPFKDQVSDMVGHDASLSDVGNRHERNCDVELQPQTDHANGKLSSDVPVEEEQDGEVQLQNDFPDHKLLLDRNQQDKQGEGDLSEGKLCSEALTISAGYQELVANPLEDLDVDVTLFCVDQQLQLDSGKIEACNIKELKDALEAEREAYSAICMELEEDRNASATAANETMAMIRRLQEEKAAVQMESRQFKRMVEEKAAFDEAAIALLKEVLCKLEAERFELEREVQLYRSRLFDCKNHSLEATKIEWRGLREAQRQEKTASTRLE